VLCLVAYGLDRSDPSNLYLGVVLIIVVVLSSSFAYVQVRALLQQTGSWLLPGAHVGHGWHCAHPTQCRAINLGSS
jgi:hypothetical protein